LGRQFGTLLANDSAFFTRAGVAPARFQRGFSPVSAGPARVPSSNSEIATFQEVTRMRKRWLGSFVVMVLAVSAGALAWPVAAAASGIIVPFETVQPLYPGPEPLQMSGSDPDWVTYGDCTLYPDSTVTLTAPDRAGHAWAAWHGTSFTRRTDDGDTWRGLFFFLDANDHILGIAPMDSALMTAVYTPYTWDYYQAFSMDPESFARAAKVEWSLSC
jgi:hypothetical protein